MTLVLIDMGIVDYIIVVQEVVCYGNWYHSQTIMVDNTKQLQMVDLEKKSGRLGGVKSERSTVGFEIGWASDDTVFELNKVFH